MARIVRMAMIGAGIVAVAGIATVASIATAAQSERSAVTIGPGPASCEPAHAHTLDRSSTAVVYALNGTAYACLTPAGTAYKLGSRTDCNMFFYASPFALAGDDVAYGSTFCGVDSGYSQVIVRSLDSGKVLRDRPGTSRSLVEQEGGIRSLVLKADGSVAWIATEAQLGNDANRLLQVRKDDIGGDTLLSSSLAVLPSSLKLHGSRLTWRDAGKLRSATLR